MNVEMTMEMETMEMDQIHKVKMIIFHGWFSMVPHFHGTMENRPWKWSFFLYKSMVTISMVLFHVHGWSGSYSYFQAWKIHGNTSLESYCNHFSLGRYFWSRNDKFLQGNNQDRYSQVLNQAWDLQILKVLGKNGPLLLKRKFTITGRLGFFTL